MLSSRLKNDDGVDHEDNDQEEDEEEEEEINEGCNDSLQSRPPTPKLPLFDSKHDNQGAFTVLRLKEMRTPCLNGREQARERKSNACLLGDSRDILNRQENDNTEGRVTAKFSLRCLCLQKRREVMEKVLFDRSSSLQSVSDAMRFLHPEQHFQCKKTPSN